ncbi:MAG: DUF1499 domain-containing protein [Rhodopila sp.]
MNPVAWLVSFLLPACGFPGAHGLPTPPLMDFAHIERPASPNTALAAPAGFSPTPDIVTPAYPVPADALFNVVQAVASEQPRTFQASEYEAQLQAHFVVRSAVFNFPDLVAVQVQSEAPDRSDLVIWSRSVYGRSDLGVNQKRVQVWLDALQNKIPSSTAR